MSTAPGSQAGENAAATSSFLSELRSSEPHSEGMPALPTRRRRIPLHLLVAAIVVGVGSASLMGMRQIGMRAGMTFETDANLLTVDVTENKDGQRLKAVMAELELSQGTAEFSRAKPEKNPFSLAGNGQAKPEQGKDESRELAERQAEEALRRQAQIESSIADLRLNGIVGGSGSYVAAIGDKNFRVGDLVAGMFTITEIDGRTVTVAVDDQLYELTIGQQPVKSSKKPGKKPAKTAK